MFKNFDDAFLQGSCHGLVHRFGVVSLDKVRSPAVANEERFELSVADSRKNCGIVDLVTIEMENREHSAISDGIEEPENSLEKLQWAAYEYRRTHLLLCQLVAKGPVSASPSPTMVKAIRFGWSKTAPKACEMEYPSSPPSWMEPGVSGVA